MLTLTAAVAQLRVTHLRSSQWLDNLSRKCALFTWATSWNYCVLDSAIFHAMLQQLQCCCFLQRACSTSTSQRPSHAETTFVDMHWAPALFERETNAWRHLVLMQNILKVSPKNRNNFARVYEWWIVVGVADFSSCGLFLATVASVSAAANELIKSIFMARL